MRLEIRTGERKEDTHGSDIRGGGYHTRGWYYYYVQSESDLGDSSIFKNEPRVQLSVSPSVNEA